MSKIAVKINDAGFPPAPPEARRQAWVSRKLAEGKITEAEAQALATASLGDLRDDQLDIALAIAQRYRRRRDWKESPDGTHDGPRWYPSSSERQPCCLCIRPPSRRWPWSAKDHCRTLFHIALLEGARDNDTIICARRMTKALDMTS